MLLDHYITATVDVAGTPVHFSSASVVNWSATSFLRDGLDLVSPLDFATGFQPAASHRPAQTTRYVVGSRELSEIIAVEGYYQYRWEPLVLPPVSSYFSTIDFSAVAANAAFLGAGQYSDLGTDLDTAFAAARHAWLRCRL